MFYLIVAAGRKTTFHLAMPALAFRPSPANSSVPPTWLPLFAGHKPILPTAGHACQGPTHPSLQRNLLRWYLGVTEPAPAAPRETRTWMRPKE